MIRKILFWLVPFVAALFAPTAMSVVLDEPRLDFVNLMSAAFNWWAYTSVGLLGGTAILQFRIIRHMVFALRFVVVFAATAAGAIMGGVIGVSLMGLSFAPVGLLQFALGNAILAVPVALSACLTSSFLGRARREADGWMPFRRPALAIDVSRFPPSDRGIMD